jgi:cytoskeletal protein CcmA (bactofilin family)
VLRLITILFFFVSSWLFADIDQPEGESSHVIVLPSGSIYQGDYFAFGDSVEISGQVNGDVYILANQIVIDGKVNGDVIAAGGSLDISGVVAKNVRALAGQVLISGNIGNNVTAVAGNVQLLGSATVGNNAVITAGNVDLSAKIGSDVTVVASNLRISSYVSHNIQAYVGQLRITSKAHLAGSVDYRSSSLAWIDQGATIQGEITHHPSLVHQLVKGTWIQGLLVGGKIVALLMNFVYSLVIGVILIKMFPKNLESALHILKTHPWKAFSWGLMLLILLPLASLILLMTILGVPFALTLIAANIIGFYTAKIYSVFWASNWIFGKFKFRIHRIPILTVGLILYFFLTSIPFLGIMISFAAMLFGLGAGVVAQARQIAHQGTKG